MFPTLKVLVLTELRKDARVALNGAPPQTAVEETVEMQKLPKNAERTRQNVASELG